MFEMFRNDPLMAILYTVAVPSTVLLVLQTVMLLFGLGHGESDVDSDFDSDLDHDLDHEFDHDCDHCEGHGEMHGDTGLRLFTVRGIIAFFAIGGWAGIAALELGASRVISCIAALLMGTGALILVAAFFKWALSLQHNGTLDFHSAMGSTGEVYLTVPANRSGHGKVNIIIQEQLTETEAVTDADRDLLYGERVRVVKVLGDNTVVVEPEK